MSYLLAVSILLEVIVVIACVLAFILKKKKYLAPLALTFAIYVFYDSARLFGASIDPIITEGSFLIATVAALWAVWGIYKSK
ncbi:MAG: hypothetical protein WC308_04275 [archaeon]|jgi:hypothetical protein